MWYRRCIFGFIKKAIKGVGKAIKGVVKGAGKIVKGVVKIQKKVFKGAVKLAKKAWKNKYIRAGIIIAAIATGVGAAALAGASGTTFGAALSSGFTGGASAFGSMLKAGFIGATGAAGSTAGLLGSGGVGVGFSSLAPGVVGAPVPTALGGAKLSIGAASGIQGAGFNLTGGALVGGGSISTPVGPAASPILVGPPAPIAASSSSGSGTFIGSLKGSTVTKPRFMSPVPSSASSVTAKTAAAKPGFLGQVGGFIKDGVVSGAKGALATVTTNTLLYGDPLGDTDGPDPLYRRGEGGRSFFGDDYSQLRSMVKPFPTLGELGADTVGSTYVTLLSNLNYGTGSRNYAINSNMALMKGIQVPQIQYA